MTHTIDLKLQTVALRQLYLAVSALNDIADSNILNVWLSGISFIIRQSGPLSRHSGRRAAAHEGEWYLINTVYYQQLKRSTLPLHQLILSSYSDWFLFTLIRPFTLAFIWQRPNTSRDTFQKSELPVPPGSRSLHNWNQWMENTLVHTFKGRHEGLHILLKNRKWVILVCIICTGFKI